MMSDGGDFLTRPEFDALLKFIIRMLESGDVDAVLEILKSVLNEKDNETAHGI